ncbi:MAG: type II toxin-antitoxin system VapC family toxin [Deltaproteobacteria bacterium]|nr:type II toxin-antitoxin system VapC family toxin [Deltaproteobacteria bacterium]
MYMLDTNICIFIIKKRPLPVLEKLEKISGEQVCISVVTFAELVYGVERSSSKKFNQEVLTGASTQI